MLLALRSPLIFAVLLGALGLLQLACGTKGSGPAPITPGIPSDILDFLRGVPGLTEVSEVPSPLTGTRFFRFRLTQPVDHTAPSGPTFTQFATLLHRSATAPLVLATTGYGIGTTPGQGEPTRLLNANQLTMEHRFFNSSTPSPVDWSKLTIAQAAADEHRLVTTFKPFYTGKWINTGGSKGGMTALFHRRFYPQDVDATLAYVAPINLANGDTRYISFLDNRGGAANRAAVEAWQQAILDRRAEVRALLAADAANRGATFNSLGLDKTLEFAMLEAPFTLWQYGDASLASQVPSPSASPQQLYSFLERASFGVVDAWSDSTLANYQAYYQQCATQLGYPAVEETHLRNLLYPGQDRPAAYPPVGVPKLYDGGAAMRDIQTWINTTAERILLVYGENDPWTAGALEVPTSAQGRGVRKFMAPNGNHGASLARLTGVDSQAATQLLSQWMGVPIAPMAVQPQAVRSAELDLAETFLVRWRR